MDLLRALWSAAVWWPAWLALSFAAFTLREAWALASGRSADTLSAWVWTRLHVVRGETVAQWGAADFLTFGCYAVLVTWLAMHFWLHRFT